MHFNKETIHRIKNLTDCKEILRESGITFNGSHISCLNPHHPDKNPSMAVYKDHLYCFSCQMSLDAIGLVQTIKNMSFKESAIWLAEKNNLNFDNKINYKNNYKDNKVTFPPTINKNCSQKQIPADNSIKQQIWEIIKDIELTNSAIKWLKSRSIDTKIAWELGCRDIQPVINLIANLIECKSNLELKDNNLINQFNSLWSPLLECIKKNESKSGLLIPIFNPDKSVHSFRWRYFTPFKREKATIKVSGQPFTETQPLGLDIAENKEKKEIIYICEGEPDWLSFYTMFKDKNILDQSAIGLCVLTNNWKQEWTNIITQYKQIYVCLHDTDKAIKLTNIIALSVIENSKLGLPYWKSNFFRKLFSENDDANDLLIKSQLTNFIYG